MLKYSDLNKEQKEFLSNGCGAKGGWIKVPNFIFLASCNKHDFHYWRGCSKEDRLISDKAFYKFMRKDVEKKYYSRWFYYSWAWTYYKAVRMFGKSSFNFSDKMRTVEDLIKEMENKK